MTFVGDDNDHQTLFCFNIKDLFTVLGWRCSYAWSANTTMSWFNAQKIYILRAAPAVLSM
jgi:hypothetical protein